jgi:hypothetical protein
VPHATPCGQRTTHWQVLVLVSQAKPSAQRRPVPQLGPPGQRLGTGAPQLTAAGSAVHAGTHAHTPFVHDVPDAQRTPQPPQLALSARGAAQ